tara:strand:+ start:768 stop:1067 length:300 start_codon:yes stop_codon:yes gene_type:complete
MTKVIRKSAIKNIKKKELEPMKTKLEKILEDLNAGNVAQAKKTLANLVANFDSESRKAFASKGGAAGKGKAKTRSPEFYKELAAKGVAARQAKAKKNAP